jgi:hypothetical protein
MLPFCGGGRALGAYSAFAPARAGFSRMILYDRLQAVIDGILRRIRE